MLDPENWKIVFGVYKGHSISALALAYQLIAIKQSLERGRKADAIKGLDLAIDGLYPHTNFTRSATGYICGDWKELSSLTKKKNSVSLV